MRFSLKDLFWSVALASGGMASVCLLLKANSWSRYEPSMASLLVAFLLFSPGVLFGAAAGLLCQKAKTGALVGFLIWFFIVFVILPGLRW